MGTRAEGQEPKGGTDKWGSSRGKGGDGDGVWRESVEG